jgi:hypothetical protein
MTLESGALKIVESGLRLKPAEEKNVFYVYSDKPMNYPELKKKIWETAILIPVRNCAWKLSDLRMCTKAVLCS